MAVLVWVPASAAARAIVLLIPTPGGNTFIRRDSLDTALKVPMWVLLTW